MMKASLLDDVFLQRLSDRMLEIDGNQFFHEQVRLLKKQHEKTLTTVKEQIARYEQERASIQAYIKATGVTADPATLQKYNSDLLEITAHISELLAKQKTAEREETALKRLRDRLRRMKTLLGVGDEGANEVSAHFLTLTIAWSNPE